MATNVGNFLKKDKPTEQQVKDAALWMLQHDRRTRSIYNTAMQRPMAMLPWIRAELKKQYGIHLRGLARKDVPGYNAEAVRKVSETLSSRPESVQEEKAPAVPVKAIRKRREDHDSLPENIRKKWDLNAERWKKMRQLHQQLAIMIEHPGYQPCDGNELCHALREADEQIRKDYKIYDSYVAGSRKSSGNVVTDNMKTIQNARSAISRGLGRQKQDAKSLEKLQHAVDTLKALKQDLKQETIDKLKAVGVNV